MKKIFILVLISLHSLAVNAADLPLDTGKKAQQIAKGSQPSVPVVKQPLPALPVTPVPVEVCAVYRYGKDTDQPSERNSAGLGDKIVIKVHGFKTLLDRANPVGGIKKDIKLFLDGRQIDDIVPVSGAPQKDEGELQFELKRSPLNDKAWSDILGSPTFSNLFERPTAISVGLDGTYAENSTIKNFKIIRIREAWFICCLVGLIFYFYLVIRLGSKTNMLRDPGIDLSPLGLSQTGTKPYSLGRVQMAFWFSIVLASFLFIWLITGNYDLITAGVLGLIGISATTALGAVTIDNSKGQDTIKAILDQQQQAATIQNDIQTLQASTPQTPASKTAIQLKQSTLNQLQSDTAKKISSLQLNTDQFINDILTDANGISFHRLQMFIWTLVLSIVFIYSVWASLVMPDFSATLLTLQGITAGTYLGFKFPEKQT